MVKYITCDAKQKTGCSYISLFFPTGERIGACKRLRSEGQSRGSEVKEKRVVARLHVGVIRSPKASLCDAGGIKITQERERE